MKSFHRMSGPGKVHSKDYTVNQTQCLYTKEIIFCTGEITVDLLFPDVAYILIKGQYNLATYVIETLCDNFHGIEYPNIIEIDYNINYSYLYICESKTLSWV